MVVALAKIHPASSTMVARTYTMVAYAALALAGGGGTYSPSADILAYLIIMFSRAAIPTQGPSLTMLMLNQAGVTVHTHTRTHRHTHTHADTQPHRQKHTDASKLVVLESAASSTLHNGAQQCKV